MADGHSVGRALVHATMKQPSLSEFIEALSIAQNTTSRVAFTNSMTSLGIHHIFLYNSGAYGVYWTINSSNTAADTALAASASSNKSSRGYIPPGGTISLDMTDRITSLHMRCATASQTTNVYGVAGQS